MSATIKDSDGTVFALDEAIRMGLITHHGLQQEPIPGWRLYGARGGDSRISNATALTLVTDVCETLVRKKYPTAHLDCRWASEEGNELEWAIFDLLEDSDEQKIGPEAPTKFQAWYAAYKEIKP